MSKAKVKSGVPVESKNRVVICEDEALIRIWLRHELEKLGFEVAGEAADGESVIGLVEQTKPDVVLMDIRLPVRDGLSATAEIMKRYPVPIIMLTAYGQDEYVQRALEAGASWYLVKPVQARNIMPAITMALGKFKELDLLRDQVSLLEHSLEQRKLIDRAKGLLMRQLGLDEPGAHQFLQRLSSQQRLPLKEVAQRVIDAKGKF